MLKKVFLYGSLLAVAIFVMQYFKLQYFNGSLKLEVYSGALVVTAILLGLWLGKSQLKKYSEKHSKLPELRYNEILSRRELEVLQLMAEGCSNQEIADQLFVSVHTVKTHTTNIYEKLQVKRRTQAVVKAREFNLI